MTLLVLYSEQPGPEAAILDWYGIIHVHVAKPRCQRLQAAINTKTGERPEKAFIAALDAQSLKKKNTLETLLHRHNVGCPKLR